MESDKSDLDLIERYLNGDLSAQDIDLVERRIEDDREFARKLRLRKTFPNVMKPGEDGTSNQPGLQDFSWEFDFKSRRHISWKRVLVITMLVIPGILFTYFFVSEPPTPSSTSPEVVAAPENDPVQIPPHTDSTHTVVVAPPIHTLVDSVANSTKAPFILVSPNDGALIDRTAEISFRWQQIPDSITHIYIISESTQTIIWWRAVKSGVREFRVPAHHFRAGKYRWYVGMKKTMRSFSISE